MQRYILLLTAAFVPAVGWSQDDLSFDVEIVYAPIVRYSKLPMRMMQELKVRMSVIDEIMDEGTVEFFSRIVGTSKDPATQAQALEALADIARRELGDLQAAIPAIRAATSSSDRAVRRAAAIAIIEADARDAAADLLQIVEQSKDERLRARLEPTLAAWKHEPAVTMWGARLTDPQASSPSVALACDGLAAVGSTESLADIRVILEKSPRFQSRIAAARAIGQLDPKLGLKLHAELADGRVPDQLAAVSLLSNDDSECHQKLLGLCSSNANAVAAAAWVALEKHDPTVLRPLFDDGVEHPDTQVRLAVVRAMKHFPTVQNCDRLAIALGDQHIVVRNNARIVLEAFSVEKPLLDRIVMQAGRAIAAADNWCRVEQSLLLAALLKQNQFSEECVPLLTHERPEVFVTAAWLMHLYPNALVLKKVTTIAQERLKAVRRAPIELQTDMGLQMAHLFQLAGFLEHKPFQSLCEDQFNKSTGVGREGRAAAMWAIGMLNRDNPSEQLVGQLVRRLNDRTSDTNPEFDLVRYKCVMSLGRMNARSQVADIHKAYKVDTPVTFIPEASRWVLARFGEEVPPERQMRDAVMKVGGWKLSPIRDR